ncbi:patatin-like phospholipase family protein [Azospirillum sp. BE72]|uniref:patatin-like phospholipase family protein n=1 Tax=Azospirillum sp. BE72 TaxID=2817776 RepID=UPI0028548D8B|nr:patatin-like phospholipase family protein [Azospirillum sp. BE72]MDR6774855.1 NTE family protein [Azospirillum sp. BE72]
MMTAAAGNERASRPRVGLVLSGGGALGAYHAGVVRALDDLQIGIDMVAGASIGALNGSVVASASSLRRAADTLTELWEALGIQSPLHPNVPGLFQLLLATGIQLPVLKTLKDSLPFNPRLLGLAFDAIQSEISLLSDGPIRKILHDVLDQDAVSKGRPFYVSVFRSNGILADTLAGIAKVLDLPTAESEFLDIQSLAPDRRIQAILASAAIPLLFGPQRVGDRMYVDGGIGGGASCQGNTPATPLVDAGCTHLIVSHLSEATLWNRRKFPDTEIIEIALQMPINRDDPVSDLLSFNSEKSSFLISRGYEDTCTSVGRLRALKQVHQMATAAESARDSAVRGAWQAVDDMNSDEFEQRFGERHAS